MDKSAYKIESQNTWTKLKVIQLQISNAGRTAWRTDCVNTWIGTWKLILSWLLSVSEHKKRLMGLGIGMYSNQCYSDWLLYWILFLFLIKWSANIIFRQYCIFLRVWRSYKEATLLSTAASGWWSVWRKMYVSGRIEFESVLSDVQTVDVPLSETLISTDTRQ